MIIECPKCKVTNRIPELQRENVKYRCASCKEIFNIQTIETWHEQFNPKQFLSRVNIEKFIEHNKAYNENLVERLGSPCIVCRGNQSPGLLLNDKSYLCKECFAEISIIKYPEKYEKLHKEYLKNREARSQARDAFIQNSLCHKILGWAGIAVWITLVLLFLHLAFVIVPVACYFTYRTCRKIHEEKLAKWEYVYPNPEEPQLRHFHDPLAELTERDRAILKVFNNWPGYPPFWGYLRDVVLTNDGNRCQVSGCPSRVELHIHHKIPVSQGGEHVPVNLVTLCAFHHALEPDEGHERVWGEIKTKYFTIVRAHKRQNSSSQGYHDVCAHLRRLELVNESELFEITKFFGFSCPSCHGGNMKITVNREGQQVIAICSDCSENLIGPRELSEETGPRLAEALTVTKNKGRWKPRWEMLERRTDSTFRLLKNSKSIPRKKQNTIASKTSNPKCPKCGSSMRLIKARKGQCWKTFWGCTKYRITGCKGSMDA